MQISLKLIRSVSRIVLIFLLDGSFLRCDAVFFNKRFAQWTPLIISGVLKCVVI